MAFIPNSNSVVSFQGNPSVLQTLAGLMSTNASVITVGTAAPNQSVSGTVGASIIGLPPFVIGGSTPASVITVGQGSIAAVIVGGSIAASFTPPANQSVSGTVGASIIGLAPVSVSNFPATQVVAPNNSSLFSLQPAGSVLAVSGSFTAPANQSVSGTVGASAIGLTPVSVSNFPANQSVSGQVTVVSSIAGGIFPISGSVAAVVTNVVNTAGSVVAFQSAGWSGSVAAFQAGAWTTSAIGTYSDSTVASTVTGIPLMFKANVSSSIMQNVSPAFPLPVSVQGTVNIGTSSGSVVAFQGTTPWLIGSVYGNISGSVAATIVGTPNVNVAGSVVAFQAAGWSGSVAAFQAGTQVTSLLSITPSSVLVGASIFGQLPGGTAVLGSVAALQATNPWNIAGSVAALQAGSWTTSVVSTIPSSMLTGNFAQRNDTVASFLGGDKTWTPIATDSAGRLLTKNFASEDGTIISYAGSIVSGSVQLIQASVIGKKSYITDFWLSNTGAATTLVTFQGGDTSVVGQFIAPLGGGMASPGLSIPLKATASQDLAFKISPSTSVLYVVVKGYQAP